MSVWKFGIPLLILALERVHSNGNANANFNASLRDYSVVEGINNTNVRTLQTGGQVIYPKFALPRTPARYNEVPDSALSSTIQSHSRGLLHHDHHEPGYEVQDYDEGPHGYYGTYSPNPEPHFIHHGHDHEHHGHNHDHQLHDHDHHLGYHHHKHYDPSLKAILLPVAGLAILGAAAALVTNPVLLQLGVVSGRRRRDAVDEHRLVEKLLDPVYENKAVRKPEAQMHSRPKIWRHPAPPLTVAVANNGDEDYNLVPIPLKLRDRRRAV